ncbi:hypothetical protein [Chamaesiphon sp. VAR_69_metabat_338]|uniref:hypothetical protein n=1 Tax=Chamaesiphon sp. VAR_69_metabat_338 TaxID=2964704 RepID=UPI00286DB977|nr:hypothetical protein [Chamaesiphon sp. VAR_69_metabat_338]
MLKSFILAATSIACTLSFASIVHAGDRGFDRNSKKQLNLIAERANSAKTTNISAADLKDIKQAIIKKYQQKNKGPEYPSATGATRFYEVKAIKLISYSLVSSIADKSVEKNAIISVTEIERIYSFGSKKVLDRNNQVVPEKYEYTYSSKDINITTRDVEITLTKRSGKWTAQ